MGPPRRTRPDPAIGGAFARRSTAPTRSTSSCGLNGFGTELEPLDPIRLLTPRGQHDDRHVGDLGPAPDLAQDIEAREAREHDVQDDQVRALLGDRLKRLGAAGRRADQVAVARQVIGHEGGDVAFVLDDEDPGRGRVARHCAHDLFLP